MKEYYQTIYDNTHILSESQDDEEKDENNHFYEFNDTDIQKVIRLKIQSIQILKKKVNLV